MKKKKLINWFILVFILLLIFFLLIYYYLFKNYGFNIFCIFHKLTGFYCPGCGITRLLFSLINLDFYRAFRYNILIFILLPFIIWFLGDYIIKIIMLKDNYVYKRVNNKIWFILLIIVLLFGVLRNVPGLDFLKPTDIM